MNNENNISTLSAHQAKYFAYELTSRKASNQLEKLTSTLSNAQVDLNPHQIEAALFAFKSPLSKGAILADEVGLGKTIEAGLVISQKWAERKRRILLIVPSNLRKQWSAELQEKFFLPSVILEAKSFNQYIKEGNLNPFIQDEKIIICSYHFARLKSPYIKQSDWDLAVIDEAHRLRNVYKSSNKIAKEIKSALADIPKILLTATPLQNSLLELYGLVSIIDDHVFGDLQSFKLKYARAPKEHDINENELGLVEPRQEMFRELRERLIPVCNRTLRRQVREYIKYTERIPLTQDYIPSEDETQLYEGVSAYLQNEKLYALPSSQRQLMTLILRKLLASSSFAIASTLKGLVYKLDKLIEEHEESSDELLQNLSLDYEALNETADDWLDDEEDEGDEDNAGKAVFTKEDIALMRTEREELVRLRILANKIFTNSKGEALLIGLAQGFEKAAELGAARKAIIFTESTVTQKYLVELLSENGYEDKIVLFNGSNNDAKSKEVYAHWLKANADTDKITGSKTADMRAALVEHFKNEAEIMIATEAGAEGINLQFCSLVINYDLPWNPQRIEQRIGRCHRYAQYFIAGSKNPLGELRNRGTYQDLVLHGRYLSIETQPSYVARSTVAATSPQGETRPQLRVVPRNFSPDDFELLNSCAPVPLREEQKFSALPPLEVMLVWSAGAVVTGFLAKAGSDLFDWTKKAFSKAKENKSRKKIVSFRFVSTKNRRVGGYVLLEAADEELAELRNALKDLGPLSDFSKKLEASSDDFPSLQQASFIYSGSEWNLAWWTDGEKAYVTDWFSSQNINEQDFLPPNDNKIYN